MELRDIKKCGNCGILISIEDFQSRKLNENEELYNEEVRKKYQDIKGILLHKPSGNKSIICPVCKKVIYNVVID